MRRHRIVALTVALVAVLATGLWWAQFRADDGASRASEPTPLYWYDPMHPETHFDAPGKSPFMDMELVPKYADTARSTAVSVAPGMTQNLGIRTTAVRRGTLQRRVEASGRIEVDETSIRQLTVRAAGWVEALHVRAEGEPVHPGQLLAEVYSPALDAAQQEYLLALQSSAPTLIDAARAQLFALGFGAAEVDRLERDRTAARTLAIRAPIHGYVMRLKVRDGAPVAADGVVFELASHDPVWLIAAVPEADADALPTNGPAVARVAAFPGRSFAGRIGYLYPDVDPLTRTRRVRVVLDNPDDLLHPGMYAQVVLDTAPQPDVLLLPSEAIIRTGTRATVIVADGDGRFRPAEVRAGAQDDTDTVVDEGLSEGERVVVSGQFLIDSEANLQGALRRLTNPSPENPQ